MARAWSVAALFGTVKVVWPYFTFWRLVEDARSKAAVAHDEKMPSSFLGQVVDADTRHRLLPHYAEMVVVREVDHLRVR